jgi:hypothetical protein
LAGVENDEENKKRPKDAQTINGRRKGHGKEAAEKGN